MTQGLPGSTTCFEIPNTSKQRAQFKRNLNYYWKGESDSLGERTKNDKNEKFRNNIVSFMISAFGNMKYYYYMAFHFPVNQRIIFSRDHSAETQESPHK